MKRSTRQEILNMLKTVGPLSVSEMAIRLEITEMAVRRHLSTLERDDLIQTELVRQAMGRPTNVYHLTEKAEESFPRNYDDIAIDFLKEIEEIDGEEKVRLLFERRKERLQQQLQERMVNLDLDKKVELLAEFQNQKGYMVELEESGEGRYILTEFNCPISKIAKEFTIACDCELQLFRDLLGVNVERNSCHAEGDFNCVFLIEASKVNVK